VIEAIADLNHRAPARILALGAHCDDIEIGCGGALRLLVSRHPGSKIRWTVFSSTPERELETRAASRMILSADADVTYDIQSFRNSYFPYIGSSIKEHMERVKSEFEPDLIFTHFEHDRHQDHRIVSELTKNAFRDHLILEYEIVKYDGDLASPNVFVPLTGDEVRMKIDALFAAFASQHSKHWFTRDSFEALMRVRGIESNAPGGFAEAFHCRKVRLGL
jgi:LmbE family N-acetylglucosaminyl deacetylase